MGLDITKGALKAAGKPKAKPKPAQRPLPSLSPSAPSASSSLGPGTPHSPAAAAPASLDSPQQPKARTKQTARRGGFRTPAGVAPSRSAPQEEQDGSLGMSIAHEGSLDPAYSSVSVYGAHGESSRRRADESVGESPPIVVDATASSSSGSGGSDGELEAQLNGPDSPWSRQYASSKAPPVVRGGRRFEQPSAPTSRSFATAAAAPRRDPFASSQDYISLEHQPRSLAPTNQPGADVGMEEATPEPQPSQGRGSSSPASKLQSPGPSVVDRYGREEDPQEQGRGQVQGGAVEECERSVGGEVGVTGASSPDVPPSYKRRISEIIGDDEGEPAGRHKRAETVEEGEFDDYDDTLSFVSNSQDRASASPDPRFGTSLGPSSLSQNSRAPGSRSTTIIETFLRSDTPFDEAFELDERDESPMAASEDERERRESTPFPFSNGDGNGDGQRWPSFSPMPADDPSSSSLEQLQPQAQPAHEPRRARATLPPSLAEHYGAEVPHPHFYHATLLAASVGAPEGEGEGGDGALSWEVEKEGFVRRFKAVTEQVGELYDRQALHFSAIAHELEQHGEHLAATAHKLGETKERVREWGKPMFEAARGGGGQEGEAAGAKEGGGKVEEKKVEEGGEQDGATTEELDANGEA